MDSETQAPLKASDPRMVAWKQYIASEEYANAKRWVVRPEHAAGSMWAAFLAGWESRLAAPHAAPREGEPTDSAQLIADLREALEHEQGAALYAGQRCAKAVERARARRDYWRHRYETTAEMCRSEQAKRDEAVGELAVLRARLAPQHTAPAVAGEAVVEDRTSMESTADRPDVRRQRPEPGGARSGETSAVPSATTAHPREGEPDVFEPLRKLASGPKGDRPDYGGVISCAEATLMLAHVASQQAALDAAGEALRLADECADDLEQYVRDNWRYPHVHPINRRKFERDMAPVLAYRAARASHPEPTSTTTQEP